MNLPKAYHPKVSEPKWQKFWEEENIYAFDPESNAEVYAIDSPPPTVSGKMHIGHAFSFSQQDFIARFQRMQGKNVFNPFGTDDNGLATERLVEKTKDVKGTKMDRGEFIKLCEETVKEITPAFIQDWKNIGISADYSISYSTINDHCRKISQRSFIDLYKKERIYRKHAPIIFCPQCQTAIAQVEMEDKKSKSTLNYIKAKSGDDYFIYATTRPEVLYGCVGMSINKDGTYVKLKVNDEVWITSKDSLSFFQQHFSPDIIEEIKGELLLGREVTIPIANINVEVTHDELTKTEYGTGIVYYCTYGGSDCIEWLGRHPDVKAKPVMGLQGVYTEGKYKGMNSSDARKAVLEDAEKENVLIFKDPIEHTVNVHERCGTDIEYIETDQWFIKYLDLKEELLKKGKEMNWYPPHMRVRYDNWILGLKWDWNISRQRFFGVPIPVWYSKKTGEVILASEDQLPVDPLKDTPKELPKGHTKNDIVGEKDILDTWATSSLTPQLATELFKDKKIYGKLFPMSLRPQAHDIITFWLFNTVVKSYLHYDCAPWKNIMISGFALDPHGKKMSKSKGNVVAPQDMMEKFSADALRFWAAGSRLGDDLPFQEKDLVTGQKFMTKLWNASKFCFMHLEHYSPNKPEKLEVIDQWILSHLSKIIASSTESFHKYEYSKTKLEVENFFWHTFCDNYLELVKDRLYNPDKRGEEGKASAQFGLYTCLLAVLKLMSPIMPHVTEELYQLFFRQHEKAKSIHISSWPDLNMVDEQAQKAGDCGVEIMQHVRKVKSEQNLSLKSPLKKIEIKGSITKDQFESVKEDLVASTKAESIEYDELPSESQKALEIDVKV